MKLYVVDYRIPRSEELDFFIIEADDFESANERAIDGLKTLNIPKRYLVNVSEVL